MKKNNLFRQIIVFLLVLTMLSGQTMTGVALASNIGGIPIISENADDITEDKTDEFKEEEVIIPVEPQENISEEIPLVKAASPKGSSLASSPKGGNGGIDIAIESSDTEVKDGDKFKFSVFVSDSDLETKPNIEEGSNLVIKLPSSPEMTSDFLLTIIRFLQIVIIIRQTVLLHFSSTKLPAENGSTSLSMLKLL